MNHFYRNVPQLGHVALTRHAQSEAQADGITDRMIELTLFTPDKPDIPDGTEIVWRERGDIRLVIITNPTPNRGAKLVKTIYRVQAQRSAK